MLNVLRHTLRGYRTGIVMVGLGLLAVSLLIVYSFDAFGGIRSAVEFEELFPESIRALLKAQGGFASDAGGYLATIYRHPINIVAISAFVIATGGGAVAREIEHGSILLVLACPVSRWRFATAKLLAMALGLMVILAAMIVGTWIGVVVTGLSGEVEMAVFLRIQLNTFALAMAIGGYALLLSALGSDGGRTIAQATGITVAMFFLDFLAALWSPASALGPLSIFHYFDPLGVAQSGGVPVWDLLVLFGVAGVTIAVALVGFQRRDIAR